MGSGSGRGEGVSSVYVYVGRVLTRTRSSFGLESEPDTVPEVRRDGRTRFPCEVQ